MIQLEKINLLSAWEKVNLFSEQSISEIMVKTRKKTKTWVFNSLCDLAKNKIIIMKKKSNLNLYSLNLQNPLTINFITFLSAQKNLGFKHQDLIQDIIAKIPGKNYSLLIFGSYAEGKEKPSSDIDICFLVENKEMQKQITPYFNDIKLGVVLEIDEHFITYPDFVKMLVNEDENLGKQIFRNNRLFYNPDIYYNLLKEAYKNGFRP